MPTSDEKNKELDASWSEISEAAPSNGDDESNDDPTDTRHSGESPGVRRGSCRQRSRLRRRHARQDGHGRRGRPARARTRRSPGRDSYRDRRASDSGRIIGKKGQVLSAIQLIVNRVVNRPGMDRRHVVVDAEGYRQRREDTLATMAQRLGKQALEEGKIITFEPMNPRDRRIVHLALAKFAGVVTKSDGEGEGRRVQIIPVRREPARASGRGDTLVTVGRYLVNDAPSQW